MDCGLVYPGNRMEHQSRPIREGGLLRGRNGGFRIGAPNPIFPLGLNRPEFGPAKSSLPQDLEDPSQEIMFATYRWF
jgi:hypothetical protein